MRAGHLVFCVGVGSDFRSRPLDTMEAHVSLLARLLRSESFDSFTYLSSTRVYQGLPPNALASEDLDLVANPNRWGDLYNLSKLAGESLCLAIDNPAIRAVRLSNVYGSQDRSDNFLTLILRQILSGKRATFFDAPTSQKDYISIADVVVALELIPLRASSRLMNLASGRNVSHQQIADLIFAHTGRSVHVRPHGAELRFPLIDVSRLGRELNFEPRLLANEFPALVRELQTALGNNASRL
jgi:nucleoside-diphosphate-sugar epimerase